MDSDVISEQVGGFIHTHTHKHTHTHTQIWETDNTRYSAVLRLKWLELSVDSDVVNEQVGGSQASGWATGNRTQCLT